MPKVGEIWSPVIFRKVSFLRELMQKVGGIWSFIIFGWILFEGADAKSWWDLDPHNFLQDTF